MLNVSVSADIQVSVKPGYNRLIELTWPGGFSLLPSLLYCSYTSSVPHIGRPEMITQSTLHLDQEWYYAQATDRHRETLKPDWQKCSSFPTSVHVELKKAGRIPDPFVDLNEWDVQCTCRATVSTLLC
jgi:hypothetical protein